MGGPWGPRIVDTANTVTVPSFSVWSVCQCPRSPSYETLVAGLGPANSNMTSYQLESMCKGLPQCSRGLGRLPLNQSLLLDESQSWFMGPGVRNFL